MSLKMGPGSCAFLHLTLVPWIPAAGELKTKPTQHSVQKLREIGIMPDALLCRADRPIPDEERAKISLFANVHEFGVISVWDVDTIYKVPRMLHAQGLDELICAKLQLHTKPANLTRWDKLVDEVEHPQHEVTIAMCGKYVDLSDSYKSLNEALRHAGIHNHARVKIEYVDSEDLTPTSVANLGRFDAILVPGGFGKRGVEGKILAAQYAREKKIPYLGICLGMQVATIEYARHKAGLAGANSTEFDPQTEHPVIALIDEWEDRDGSIQKRTAQSDLGGTMRLGAQSSDVKPGTLAHEIYGNVADRAPSPPLRGQRALPRPAHRGRPGDLGDHAAREAHRDGRAADRACIPGSSACSSTRSSSRRRGAATRSSSRSSTPRSRTRPSARRRSPLERAGMKLCGFEVGLDRPLFLIAGPCVVESEQLQMDVAGQLKEIAAALGVPFIFKSSYDKANRSSGTSFRGPGIDKGLEILAKVKRELGVPVITDVHREDEIGAAASVVDVLQTPAFLCRQTDFIRAVAQSGKPVNIKKGQFLAPHDMKNVLDKARAAARDAGLSEDRFMACERGASFGYNNLVSDMRSLAIMRETNAPVVFDATHSVQLPGGQGTSSGGQREFVPVLARAAVAVGVAGVFMETHPDPAKALSDGPERGAAEAHARAPRAARRARPRRQVAAAARAGVRRLSRRHLTSTILQEGKE